MPRPASYPSARATAALVASLPATPTPREVAEVAVRALPEAFDVLDREPDGVRWAVDAAEACLRRRLASEPVQVRAAVENLLHEAAAELRAVDDELKTINREAAELVEDTAAKLAAMWVRWSEVRKGDGSLYDQGPGIGFDLSRAVTQRVAAIRTADGEDDKAQRYPRRNDRRRDAEQRNHDAVRVSVIVGATRYMRTVRGAGPGSPPSSVGAPVNGIGPKQIEMRRRRLLFSDIVRPRGARIAYNLTVEDDGTDWSAPLVAGAVAATWAQNVGLVDRLPRPALPSGSVLFVGAPFRRNTGIYGVSYYGWVAFDAEGELYAAELEHERGELLISAHQSGLDRYGELPSEVDGLPRELRGEVDGLVRELRQELVLGRGQVVP